MLFVWTAGGVSFKMADASSSKHVEQAFISSPSILAEHFTDLNVDLCAREFSNYLNVNLSSQVVNFILPETLKTLNF